MPWIPLTSRSSDLQSQLQAACGNSSDPAAADAFYNENELGMLDEPALAKWLQDRGTTNTPNVPSNPSASTTTSEDSTSAETSGSMNADEYKQVRSLRWIIANAERQEDKEHAEREYQRLLFDLWQKHVDKTGNTYYSVLNDDLFDEYLRTSDDDHS